MMKIFDSIPNKEPTLEFLNGINSPEDLRKLDKNQMSLAVSYTHLTLPTKA